MAKRGPANLRWYGWCWGCGFWRRVNQDGTIRVHRHVSDARRPDRCEGSGSEPRTCLWCEQPDCYLCIIGGA
jgi:hypothetical protein